MMPDDLVEPPDPPEPDGAESVAMSQTGNELGSGTPGLPGLTDLTEIGRGSYGVVYRARQERLRRFVAVKVLNARLGGQSAERFTQECRALGALSGHPHIVAVYEADTTEHGEPYLVMPFCERGSLAARLAEGTPLSWQETLDVGVRLAGALQTAHDAGILHRDIKPGNVLVDGYGNPQLADFGQARLADSDLTGTGGVIGTPAYAAPEVLRGGQATPAADVHSLAAALVALLTGRGPYSRHNTENIAAVMFRVLNEQPADLREHGVPPKVAEVLEWALQKDPDGRPPSAAVFGKAMQGLQRQHDLSATPLIVAGAPESDRTPPPAPAAAPPPGPTSQDSPADAPPPGPAHPDAPPAGPPWSGPAQSGPAQSGPAQSGPAQSGPAQSGPAQSGSSPAGPPQSGPAQSGPAQSGSSPAGPPQSGPAQSGPSPAGPAWSGSAHSGPPPIGSAQSQPAQRGPAQAGPTQPGPAQAGPAQAGPAQPGPAHSGAAYSGAAQSGPLQPGFPPRGQQGPPAGPPPRYGPPSGERFPEPDAATRKPRSTVPWLVGTAVVVVLALAAVLIFVLPDDEKPAAKPKPVDPESLLLVAEDYGIDDIRPNTALQSIFTTLFGSVERPRVTDLASCLELPVDRIQSWRPSAVYTVGAVTPQSMTKSAAAQSAGVVMKSSADAKAMAQRWRGARFDQCQQWLVPAGLALLGGAATPSTTQLEITNIPTPSELPKSATFAGKHIPVPLLMSNTAAPIGDMNIDVTITAADTKVILTVVQSFPEPLPEAQLSHVATAVADKLGG
jgi:serine/threonine protein kinase